MLTQSDFEIIDDRLRGILPEGLFYQIRLTFNPVSSHHWIKKVFFDRVDPDVLTHQSTYENNRFIDEAYHRRMLRRKEVDPEGYRVYGLGVLSVVDNVQGEIDRIQQEENQKAEYTVLGRNENSILEMITIIKEYAERNGEEPVDVFNKILGEGVNGNEE